VPPNHQSTYIELANLEMKGGTGVDFDRQPGIRLVKREIRPAPGALRGESPYPSPLPAIFVLY
jgi:hypothetical protein